MPKKIVCLIKTWIKSYTKLPVQDTFWKASAKMISRQKVYSAVYTFLELQFSLLIVMLHNPQLTFVTIFNKTRLMYYEIHLILDCM